MLSLFDGFVGWLVLFWTLLLAVPLWQFYAARGRRLVAREAAAGRGIN